MPFRHQHHQRHDAGVRRTRFVLILLVALALPLACQHQSETPTPTPASHPSTSPSATAPRSFGLTARMRILATQPAGQPTGLFLDRRQPGDLRVVSYNVNWDRIFPGVDATGAERFQRVLKALAPDILALQEIKEYEAADVAALLNAICPRADGRTWHAYKGWTNVIASPYALYLTRAQTDPPGQRGLALALVDLPDDRYAADVYVLNNHFKCCGGKGNDPQRQQQADALVAWLRDARTPGGALDLPPATPAIILGDFNIVGGWQPVQTLLTGDICDEQVYGPDALPDWDGSSLTDAHPFHNATGPDDYTWRNDDDQWPPGRLDFILYTDSVLTAVHQFVLNPTLMPTEELERAGLEPFDVTLDTVGRTFDHLPLVVDFRLVKE
ncbi:MAG: endonuclease/exonuclease/phosphatase family protein [Planctomycetes bacterium]|nr:endonuclease/exonuclease/phosphatase family protein [Planctomycetota bacterium]